jgi:hypothetical protein
LSFLSGYVDVSLTKNGHNRNVARPHDMEKTSEQDPAFYDAMSEVVPEMLAAEPSGVPQTGLTLSEQGLLDYLAANIRPGSPTAAAMMQAIKDRAAERRSGRA